MIILRNYMETSAEIRLCQLRLEILLRRQEELWARYVDPKAPRLDEPMRDSNFAKGDERAQAYFNAMNEVNEITGMSLEQEIEYQRKSIRENEKILNRMDRTLRKLKGTAEWQIYREIVMNGTPITKAIVIVAEYLGKDPSTLWKVNYPKIKDDLKKLEKK